MGVPDLPPLRQHIEAISPNGRHYRWGEDEPDPANVPSDLRHSSTMPGGFESCDVTLPRKPGIDYSDLERLSTIRVIGAGGDVAWEGRLERTPRVSGDQMAISPSAVGWQAHLDDDKSVRFLGRDIDLTRWGDVELERKLVVLAGGITDIVGSPEVVPDSENGAPVLELATNRLNTTATTFDRIEAWYDAGAGPNIGKLYYESIALAGGGPTWDRQAFLSSTVAAAAGDRDDGTDHGAVVTTVTATLSATAARRYAVLLMQQGGAVFSGDGDWRHHWRPIVYGDHGLALRGTEPDAGFYDADLIGYAISRWCPLLNYTSESLTADPFIISQSAFLDPTTVAEIVRQTTRFGLRDWAVWDDRTFWLHDRGARGRKWRARISPAQLEETGPQVDRVWESVIVSYQDVDGTTRTVGPPGSGADTEDATLHDSDPENPANKAGIVRRDLLQMGVTTAAGATEVGRRFLEQTKLLDTSGRARLVGHVEDDRGVLHPYWRVRAGDTITFVDAADTGYRRIVRADHTRSDRTCSIDLDAPPEGLQALLERLGVVLVPLGL